MNNNNHTINMINEIKQIIKGYLLWIWYYLYKPYRDQRKEIAKNRIFFDLLSKTPKVKVTRSR
jgi:hypothetical protein